MCFVIFGFFNKLLRIYQISTDQYYTKKNREASLVRNILKFVIFFVYCLDLHLDLHMWN
jgi:hypothetical protein